MEFVKYNLLSKNKDYEGTAIADCGFAHIFSTIKKGEGPGYRVIGEALSSDLISFLQEIMRKYPRISDTHIYPISMGPTPLTPDHVQKAVLVSPSL